MFELHMYSTETGEEQKAYHSETKEYMESLVKDNNYYHKKYYFWFIPVYEANCI